MIATTNLTGNMDPAFERRFLYKIEFGCPSAGVRARIWQSLIPSLDAGTAEELASLYDFSGGQIENIARKCSVAEVLYGALDIPASGLSARLRDCPERNPVPSAEWALIMI